MSNTIKKGILHKIELSENIKKINLYTEEENKRLNKIHNQLLNCLSSYNSSDNSSMFSNKINKLEKDIPKLQKKRIQYSKVLTDAIIMYDTVSGNTRNFFGAGDEK